MGLRKDLDSVKERYVYYLMHGDRVIYVGTTVNWKARYKSHLKRIKEKNNAKLYNYCREQGIEPTVKIVCKFTATYAQAEVIEIEHIEKHQDTILNFYNNPKRELKGKK